MSVDVAKFHELGYSYPLRVMSSEEMAKRRDELVRVASEPSPIFSQADVDKNRWFQNRHLDSLAVLDLACRPEILDAVAAVLGPDLILWRSSFFIQGKTDPETIWHQDRSFSGPRRLPALVIPDANGNKPATMPNEDELRGNVPVAPSVSAWIAVTDTDRDSGCVMVVESSNAEGVIPVRKPRPGEKAIFGKGTVLDYEIPQDRVRYMELEAGGFFMFDRLTLHASVPTKRDASRIGITVRYTTPDTLVYPGYTVDGHGFSVAGYRAILVKGEARKGLNEAILERAEQRRESLSKGT